MNAQTQSQYLRTNIVLDVALVNEALECTHTTTKREVIELALRELVQNRKRRDIRDLKGKIKIRDDYDYKALRAGK